MSSVSFNNPQTMNSSTSQELFNSLEQKIKEQVNKVESRLLTARSDYEMRNLKKQRDGFKDTLIKCNLAWDLVKKVNHSNDSVKVFIKSFQDQLRNTAQENEKVLQRTNSKWQIIQKKTERTGLEMAIDYCETILNPKIIENEQSKDLPNQIPSVNKWPNISTLMKIGVIFATLGTGLYFLSRGGNASKSVVKATVQSEAALMASYNALHSTIRHYLKNREHTLNWLVEHGKITLELAQFIMEKGLMKKHWGG